MSRTKLLLEYLMAIESESDKCILKVLCEYERKSLDFKLFGQVILSAMQNRAKKRQVLLTVCIFV